MATAITLEQYLDARHVPFDLVAHKRSHSSMETAHAAGVDPQSLAKAVILHADGRYVMAVLAADRRLQLSAVRRQLGCPVGMATEAEVQELFADCARGAVPALGIAYGLEVLWDDDLEQSTELFFEAGDHEHLVAMRTREFLELMGNSRHGHFARSV
jgi:Ala-tRNA(Pro) deacylase